MSPVSKASTICLCKHFLGEAQKRACGFHGAEHTRAWHQPGEPIQADRIRGYPAYREIPTSAPGYSRSITNLETPMMFNGYQVNSHTNIGSHPVKGWRLPGQGVAYTSCGHSQTIGCLNAGGHSLMSMANKHGIAKRVLMRCRRPSCPVCSRTWMVETTKDAEFRILIGKPRHRRRAIHVTISPPPELYSKDTEKDFHNLRRMANKWLKVAGLTGYMLIYHPFRQNKEKMYEGTPQHLQWRYSPHFHALGYGWIKWGKEKYQKSIPNRNHKTKEQLDNSKGWIVKNHRVRKSIGATIYYQLSHAGVKELRKVVSWGGTLSWKQHKIPKKRKVKLECPLCGKQFRPVKYVGRGSCPLEGSPQEELIYIDHNYYKYGNYPGSGLYKK